MTPLKYSNKTPSEYTNGTSLDYDKITPLVLKEASLDYSKVIPLEVAYIDTHKDTPKLNAEHIVLLKPKRLSRIRYTRYKA